MSKKIVTEVRAATRIAGGGTLTKINRASGLNKFFRVMKKQLNVQIMSFEKLKTSQVKVYVEHLKKQGMTMRSIQNQLAHIRQALRACGRSEFASSHALSNEAMGVSGASRNGTHRPPTDLQYTAAVAAAKTINPGAACCLQLQRELGLRAREAIQSCVSLAAWEKALTAGVPSQIVHGTKGGRPRQLAPLDVARALSVVRTARLVAQAQGGVLIVAMNLRAAARAYGRVCERVGLKGELASHSLRCRYARDRFADYMARHGDRREALAATSLDLGHGDGRGTYVAQVYLKNTESEKLIC